MEGAEIKSTAITEFFRGANVFITGGSGFMGKVLVEKLLRSCPHIGKIFLMVRTKRGKDEQARLDRILDKPLFDLLRKEFPDFRQKIIIVSGDCEAQGLGISSSDRRLLIEEVDVVFHAAATVKFDEKLRVAFTINAVATEEILKMAHEMKKLKALVHVSTAYCNCHLPEIEEKFYTYPFTFNNIKAIVTDADDVMLEAVTATFLKVWPNTYTFTKAIAEDLVRDQGVGLPIGVFRPAIGGAAYKEPMPGWIDTLHGPSGGFVGGALGIIHVLYGDQTTVANIIPVDMAINALIASAWDIANRPRPQCGDDIPVFNYVSSPKNPIRWMDFDELRMECLEKFPSSRTVYYPQGIMTTNRFLYVLLFWLWHYLPAAIVDALALVIGKKPVFVKLYRKIYQYCEVIKKFSFYEWKFTNDNVIELQKKLKGDDKDIFFFDMEKIDRRNYMMNFLIGMRIYLTKDDMSTVPQARIKLRRLYYLDLTLKIILALLLIKLLWTLFI